MASIYQIRREIEDFEYECNPETGELLNALEWDKLLAGTRKILETLIGRCG